LKKHIHFFFILPLFFNCSCLANASTLNGEPAHSKNDENIKTQDLTISEFKGITLIGITPSKDETFNVPIVTAEKALKVIKQALVLIEMNSPFSKSQIELLMRNGQVIIVYDPRYPKENSTSNSVQIALFSPNYYNLEIRDNKGKNFLVIVSRHGVKWPIKELAAVLVHELVGHGIQHLSDNFSKMRLTDLECEAWLYEEMAYQDLKMDKYSREMINFKKQLENQCDSFIRYLRDSDPIGALLWDNLNPDIPKLLEHFAVFLKQIE